MIGVPTSGKLKEYKCCHQEIFLAPLPGKKEVHSQSYLGDTVLCVTTPPSALRDIFGAVAGESGDNILS
jgi:hypothetical protein